jgi:hypothetical protein
LILLLATPLTAQVTMTAQLDKEQINLDQNVHLHVTLSFSQQGIQVGNIQLPTSKEYELDGTTSQQQIMMINGQYNIRKTIIYSLMPVKAGIMNIPPIASFFIDPNTQQRKPLETPPLTVKVIDNSQPEETPAKTSSDEAKSKPEPVFPKEDPFSFTLFILAGTTALIIALTFTLSWYFRKQKNTESATFDLKVENSGEAKRIREVKKNVEEEKSEIRMSRERLHLLARDNEKEFCREMGNLLRSILESNCNQSFNDKTGSEILDSLDYLRLGGEARELVTEIVEYLEEVSYCGGSRSMEEREELIEKLRRIKQLIKQ